RTVLAARSARPYFQGQALCRIPPLIAAFQPLISSLSRSPEEAWLMIAESVRYRLKVSEGDL
ncbi:MAG: hypothetical protein ACE5MK_10065, partial [Acidobacteriota bacterium]